MHPVIKKIWYPCWGIFAGILILIAVVFSALRFMLPFASDYKHDVESLVAGALGKSVEIVQLDADWQGLSPRLRLLGVHVFENADKNSLLHVKEINLTVGLWGSLYSRNVVFKEISIVGVDLNIKRDSENQIFVQGIRLLDGHGSSEKQLAIPEFFMNKTVRLLSANIHYEDVLLNINDKFSDFNLSLQYFGKQKNIYLSSFLPDRLGKYLEIGLEFSGELTELDQWAGDLYIKTDQINVAQWLKYFYPKLTVNNAILNAELWGGWYKNKIDMVRGKFDLTNLELPIKQSRVVGKKLWHLDGVSSDVFLRYLNNEVYLSLDDLNITQGENTWEPTGIGVLAKLTEKHQVESVQAVVDHVELENVASISKVFAELNQELVSKVQSAKPEGIIENLVLSCVKNKECFASADFESIGFVGKSYIPSVVGLDGNFYYRDKNLSLELDSKNVVIEFDTLFRNPLLIDKLEGHVWLNISEKEIFLSGSDIALITPHIKTNTVFDIEIPKEGSSYLSINSTYEDGDAKFASLYLPVEIMGPRVVEWLDNAVIGGRLISGFLEIDGPADKFPFRNNEGIFNVEFDIDKVQVDYFKDWPGAYDIEGHVQFYGPGLAADIHSARILDATIFNMKANIVDFRQASLILEGGATASLEDTLHYIKSSDLIYKYFSPVIDFASGEGNQITYFDLKIPLKTGLEFGFKGSTELFDTKLIFNDWGLTFSDVETQISYSADAIYSNAFEPLLNNRQVSMKIDTEMFNGAPHMMMDLTGRMSANDLLSPVYPDIAEYVSGDMSIRTTVDIPLVKKTSKDWPGLQVETDMLGASINLPAPFYKSAETSSAFLLETDFIGAGLAKLKVNYADWVNGQMLIGTQNNSLQIEEANFAIGADVAAKLQGKPTIQLHGNLNNLDLDEWESFAKNRIGSSSFADRINGVNLEIGKLKYLDQEVDNVTMDVNQKKSSWNVTLDSSPIKGKISIPKRDLQKQGLAFDLDVLDINQFDFNGGTLKAPASLPPFKFFSERLYLYDWKLDKVSVLAKPLHNGLKIKRLNIDDESLNLSGNGVWLFNNGKHSTKLKTEITSKNLGEGLSKLGFLNLIQDGEGSAKFDIGWAASPANFDLGLLYGKGNLNFKAGQILDVKPGAGGRLFGLMSVQTIPRRLALDFKDIFSKGFRFDKMYGSFDFVDGDAFTDDYIVDSPVGKIEISGRTGLVNRDYNQKMTFTPDLSSSLPIIGTIFGDVATGGTLIVADLIARMFGKQADDLGKVKYTLQGTWEDPVIESVKKSDGKKTQRPKIGPSRRK